MPQRTILIVDDDPLILQFLMEVLKPLGHQIVTATEGYEATMRAQQDKPDLIITDIEMPAGSGPVFYDRVQHFSGSMGKPVIFISGRQDGAQLVPSKPNVRFIPKPVDIEVLLTTIEELLPSERPPAPDYGG
jgi:CheY-like chemotaxis protein